MVLPLRAKVAHPEDRYVFNRSRAAALANHGIRFVRSDMRSIAETSECGRTGASLTAGHLFFFILKATILCACTLSWASANEVRYRALLVGVSEYPAIDQRYWLEGPANDVERIRGLLRAQGFSSADIRVLNDGDRVADLPTRANTLSALESLAESASDQDYIVVYMAGHGSQVPVSEGHPQAHQEPDGLFEVFLPRDVETWSHRADQNVSGIPNAIYDYEVRALVDRMTERGAFVWAIFDACHSATMVRAPIDSHFRLRQIAPTQLGVPAEALSEARSRVANHPATRAVRSTSDRGSAVFFYAAQTDEPTPEMRLPRGSETAVTHGLFTYTLAAALDGRAGLSYRQLAQQILIVYGTYLDARSTPLFTGGGLDSPVLGRETPSPRQWLLDVGERATVPVGILSGIDEGSLFAILRNAGNPDSSAIAMAQVVHSHLHSSELTLSALDGSALASTSSALRGSVARLLSTGFRNPVRVDHDLSACTSPCPFKAAIGALKADTETAPQHYVWVQQGDSPHLTLQAQGHRLWLIPASSGQPPSCADHVSSEVRFANCSDDQTKRFAYVDASDTATVESIRSALHKQLSAASRASNLMRIVSRLTETGVASKLEVTMKHLPATGGEALLDPSHVAMLNPGDRVRIAMRNRGPGAVDVTALYLDSMYGVGLMYPDPGASNRLDEGATTWPIEIEITDDTLGLERMLILAVRARAGSERADYSYLAQAPLGGTLVRRGSDRAGSGLNADLLMAFEQAGFSTLGQRTARAGVPMSDAGVHVFSWRVEER